MDYAAQRFRISSAALLLAGSGIAAEASDGSSLSVKFATPTYYTSNAGFTRDNPIDTAGTSPAASLAFTQKLTDALSLKLGSTAIVERYSNSNFAVDTWVANAGFSYKLGGWTYDIAYRPRWIFAPGFTQQQVRFDDVTALATAPVVPLGAAGTLTYQLGYRERFATIATLSSHQPFAVVSWSKDVKLEARTWTLGLDTTVAFPNLYRSVTNPKDAVVAPTAYLSTDLSKTIELRFSADYVNRWSSESLRQANSVTFGAALVFSSNIF